MPIEFACHSCGARYQVDPAHAGKTTRCKACGKPMTVPRPVEADPDDDGTPYALDDPIVEPEPVAAGPTTFVRAPADTECESHPPRRRPRPDDAPRAKRRRDRPAFVVPHWKWLVGVPLGLLVVLAPVILLVPTARTIAGLALTLLGMLALVGGYGVGAFAAFSEEFIYGMLYLCIPLYTGYYLISRLDGTWPLIAAMAGGAALITVGVWLMEAGTPSSDRAAPEEDVSVSIPVRATDGRFDRVPGLLRWGT